ncbi:MAG: ArsR/SmtB family transcription factor [Devosia sp.]|jgi:DNA-binding transcriptional ArsR family regulator
MGHEKVLNTLGDPTRRSIFEKLREGPLSVTEIANDMPVSRPAVSQHLALLKEAGLVTDKQQGRRNVYYIDPEGLSQIRIWLDQFWDIALSRFKEKLESQEQDKKAGKK